MYAWGEVRGGEGGGEYVTQLKLSQKSIGSYVKFDYYRNMHTIL
jgi:hypothetical protein